MYTDDAGTSKVSKQQQLGPESKALMHLSKEKHSGWIAKLGRAQRSHRHAARAHSAAFSMKHAWPASLQGSKRVCKACIPFLPEKIRSP